MDELNLDWVRISVPAGRVVRIGSIPFRTVALTILETNVGNLTALAREAESVREDA